jgi:hypothetical protein
VYLKEDLELKIGKTYLPEFLKRLPLKMREI